MRTFVAIVLLALGCLDLQAQGVWRLVLPRTAYTIQVNPLDPKKVYVGSHHDVLWRSYDGGETWDSLIINETQAGETISSLVVSAADTNVILTGGFSSNGMRRSTDGGATSTPVLTDPEHGRIWFISEAIIEHPSNPLVLYGVRGVVKNSVYKSVDGGATWTELTVIDAQLAQQLCTIAIRPDSTNIMFIGARPGAILRSDDAGVTWRRVRVRDTSTSVSATSEIPKIVFSPRDPMVGYAVSAFNNKAELGQGGGLLKTTDGGATWHRKAFGDTSIWAVEVRASADGTNDDVFIGGFRLSKVDAGVQGDSLVARSTDGGETWTHFSSIPWLPSEDGIVYANTWCLRYSKAGKKMYLGTEDGLYVFDEPTHIDDEAWSALPSHSMSLEASVVDNTLYVKDLESAAENKTWFLYNMQGAAVATGHVGSLREFTVALSNHPCGRYLLTVTSAAQMRSVSILVR